MQAKIFKENSLNELNALKSTTQLLDIQSIWYQQAFSRLFGDSFRTFEFQLSQHMNNLETLLNAETLHEMDSKSSQSVIQIVNQKHDELTKKSLLNRSQFEGQLKEKTKVISDLKVKEGKDIDTMIEMDKQIKFLNEILYKRNQSIQTIHMLAPKCATYNGRSTFANPKYLKMAQSDKPRLYEIPYDTSDPANRFCPNGEETVTLEKESRSKLDKDTILLDLSKPVTTHYLPKRREFAKPHNMIATSSSRYSSNDIVHNHYLEEAKKKTQEHSRNSRNFSDSKHFVCSTCQKCVFNANHDSCVTKFLKEVNSRAKVPSNKTTNRNKPVEQIRVATKPNRQIPTGHRFSIKRTSTVHEKTTSPRSCLRWQPTGRILKTVCLRWVPTGKIFTSSTTKVDSEPPNGSKEDITNQCESEQALDVSAYISENRASRNFDLMINIMTFEHISSGLVLHQMVSAENNTSGPVPQCSNDVCSHQFRPRSSSNDF
ncbi:hypothetical protein Tco_0610791 [Tanacetum coccineum]